jgi:ABC-type nitrate/sulfonate/bicarbonate transport system substrate-binding protein
MRRLLLAALLLGLPAPWRTGAAPAPQGPGESASKLPLLRVIVFTPDAATVAARAHGLFTAEGLDIELIVTPNSTVQMRGLSDGTYHVAFTAFDNVLAWSGREGAEIVAIAQAEASPVLPVFARPEIASWDDLRGQPLAVDAADTAFALVLRAILLDHGLDLEHGDYTIVPVGATQMRFESILRGDTVAGILNAPWDARAREAGLRLLGDQREVLPRYPGTVIAVNRAWAQAHPELVRAFLRGWQAGRQWVADQPTRARQLLAAELGVSEEVAAGRLAQLLPSPELDVEGLQSVLALRLRFGYQPPLGAELARYLDSGYLR